MMNPKATTKIKEVIVTKSTKEMKWNYKIYWINQKKAEKEET